MGGARQGRRLAFVLEGTGATEDAVLAPFSAALRLSGPCAEPSYAPRSGGTFWSCAFSFSSFSRMAPISPGPTSVYSR